MLYRVGQKVWTCYHPYSELSDDSDIIHEIDKKYWRKAIISSTRPDGSVRMVEFEDKLTWYVENHNIKPYNTTLRGTITEQLMAGEI